MSRCPLRGVEVKQVVVISVCEGEGTQDAPARLVTYVFDLDGTEIAKRDPFVERPEAYRFPAAEDAAP